MSEKVEMTINFPQLTVTSPDGQLWKPFDIDQPFHRGLSVLTCDVCGGRARSGFREYMKPGPRVVCRSCVTLNNPWEVTA